MLNKNGVKMLLTKAEALVEFKNYVVAKKYIRSDNGRLKTYREINADLHLPMVHATTCQWMWRYFPKVAAKIADKEYRISHPRNVAAVCLRRVEQEYRNIATGQEGNLIRWLV